MKIIYLDPVGGIAGDMFLSALLDALNDRSIENKMLRQLERLPIAHWQWKEENVRRGSFCGTKIDFQAEEEATHRHLSDIIAMVKAADFPTAAEAKILETFDILAEAESKVHGVSKEEVHFHEVGAIDTILDICAVCYLLTEISVEKILCAPLPMGNGTLRCAHGEISLPAPAVAALLTGAKVKKSDICGETVTPTGIALLKAFSCEFQAMPTMEITAYGCGCGTRNSEIPNLLRLYLGATEDPPAKNLYRLECTIDDMTGEEMGYLWEKIDEAGANHMHYTPIFMKKGRPAIQLTVLTEENKREEIEKIIFTHTTTLGLIRQPVERSILQRRLEKRSTPQGDVNYKIAEGYGIRKEKAEYEDLKKIADRLGISLKEVRSLLEQDFKS